MVPGDEEEAFQEERWVDPVVEAYKKDVDRTLLRENLKLTPEERLRKLQAALDAKYAAGRPKDLEATAELEALAEEGGEQ